jgi:hypothetical protein
VEAVYVVDKQMCNLAGCVRVFERDKMGIFGEFVNDYQQAIVSARSRQSINEIHGGNLPWLRRNWQGLEQSSRRQTLGLSLLAGVTGSHIFTNLRFHFVLIL